MSTETRSSTYQATSRATTAKTRSRSDSCAYVTCQNEVSTLATCGTDAQTGYENTDSDSFRPAGGRFFAFHWTREVVKINKSCPVRETCGRGVVKINACGAARVSAVRSGAAWSFVTDRLQPSLLSVCSRRAVSSGAGSGCVPAARPGVIISKTRRADTGTNNPARRHQRTLLDIAGINGHRITSRRTATAARCRYRNTHSVRHQFGYTAPNCINSSRRRTTNAITIPSTVDTKNA